MTKKNILNYLVIISMIILLIEIFNSKILITDTINSALNIWVNSLIPTMFPFFVISDILINYHITDYIPNIIKNTFCKLFNVSANVITIFFLSCIGGFPSNARNIRSYYDLNLISKEEAEHTLMFTHFSNPMFILTTVGVTFLGNKMYGVIILISHFLGNIIIGILGRDFNTPSKNYTCKNNKSQNFSSIFIHAIKSSIDSLLLILGTLTSFLIVSSLLIDMFYLSIYPSTILKGILEITIGLKDLSSIGILDIYKVVIATMFISFGGLSVHLQVLSNIVDTDISYFNFFISRIIHSIISGLLAFIFYLIFI